MNIFIYNKKNLKLLGQPIAPNFKEFTEAPNKYYPNWDTKLYIASDVMYNYPILDNNILREKTREERIIMDECVELLKDGEYIGDNAIKIVEKPKEIFMPVWDKTENLWKENATISEINTEINRLISVYVHLAEQKEKYEKYNFDTFKIEMEMSDNILRRNILTNLKEK